MVARKFVVSHDGSTFEVDYDTEDGLEVFKFQLFSLISVPPDEQKIIGENDDRVVSDDADLMEVCNKLRLVSVGDQCEEKRDKTVAITSENSDAELLMSDEELARMLQEEEEAMLLQQYVAGEDSRQFEQEIRPYINQVLMYEDPQCQEAARNTVPVEELEEKALVALAKERNFKPSKVEQDYAFLLQLLFWFKKSFRWVNQPPCDGCGSKTVGQGMGSPLTSELRYGANRVELYRCIVCSRIIRFPRYNDPLKLIETRSGRCGEWANCFTLYCRSFGYDTRLILDFTDHVWTECFSHCLGRWVHLDPCEGVYDKPLLYEKGWNKKLNYVIALAKDGVYDVTKRYTKKWDEVSSRRSIIAESALEALLDSMTKECRSKFPAQVLPGLKVRDKNEQEELERNLHSPDDASVSLPGRQSGDKDWRVSRSEFGSDEHCSVSSNSCPVRICVDEHVTRTYNAFLPVLSHFTENLVPKSRATEVFEILKGFLMDLHSKPHKTRKAFLKLDSDGVQSFMRQILPSLEDLLHALSLKSEISDTDGCVSVFPSSDPVRTSLALPVAVDAFEELIRDLDKCQNFGKDSLSFPLLKLNRVSSGAVLASGEELPWGIATSAFDGLKASKWEEPNGAKGCWIMYKCSDNQMHELVAYELMSANDAPERDPKNWVLEGSSDGGANWHVLDHQTSQEFEDRFQRKLYKVKSAGFRSNLFRFRFLSARVVEGNSRLQIGSIDLYAKKG